MIRKSLKSILTFLFCVASAVGQANPNYRALTIPGEFPKPEAVLLQIRDEQDVQKMREHAWSLFAGLTKLKDSRPLWATWYTKCDVGLQDPACPQLPRTDLVIEHKLIRGLEFSGQALLQLEQTMEEPAGMDTRGTALSTFIKDFSNHPEFAAVLFNRPAAKHIVETGLNDANELANLSSARQQLHSFKREQEVPPFPNDAVVLKTAWQLVEVRKNDVTSPVWLWDSDPDMLQTNPNDPLPNSSYWGKPLVIDLRQGRKCADIDYDKVAPLDCFYAIPIDADTDIEAWKLMKLVGDLGYFIPHQGKYYLVLMAMHVITKETADWTWTTFWWHSRFHDPTFGSCCPGPKKLTGNQWRHFLMNTTLSRVTPLETPPQLAGPKVCFNPYLEEVQPNGRVSNCMQCHRRAVYGPKGKVKEGQALGGTWRDGTTPASGVRPDPHYFDDSLRTDYIWSIGVAQDQDFKNTIRALRIALDAK